MKHAVNLAHTIVNLPGFPQGPGFSETPVWTGSGFQIGDRHINVWSYESGSLGWTDELTSFHEELSDGSHSIDVASRQHTLATIAKWQALPAPVIIDIRCSSGYMLRDLRARFPQATLIGADYVRGPLEKLAQTMPDIPMVQLNLVECPLPSNCLDTAILLNVLEHIEEDAAAVKHVHRILRPGGIALIEVPAGPDLYDVYDKQLLHFRRYKIGRLRRLLEEAGFQILTASHLGFFLYPLFALVKKRNKRHLEASTEVQRQIVSGNIVSAGGHWLPRLGMLCEAALRPHVPYPVGIRCLVTARKL